MVERGLCKPEVVGSNPIVSTAWRSINRADAAHGFIHCGVFLAQLNIAKMRAPMTSATMSGFVARIAEVNARAEAAEGFVWRLKDLYGPGALDQRIFGDDALVVNLSVWTDSESLFDFVYRDARHRDALHRRREWFDEASEAMVVCWWVAPSQMPTVAEAQERLVMLREEGPSAHAFGLRRHLTPPFAPPEEPARA